MHVIKGKDVINIMRRTYNLLDVRLVDHGERVAYMMYEMIKDSSVYSEHQIQEICAVAFLHDIGAYKTEEIDRMVEFESTNIWEHSIYGSLFLENMSPLAEYAEVILYHHLPFSQYDRVDFAHKSIAALLHLADRIDALLISGQIKDEAYFTHFAYQFNSADVQLFREANERDHIVAHLLDGSYHEIIQAVYERIGFSESEIQSYLELLAFSIDFRSEFTVSHTITTVGISMAIAEALGLPEIERYKIHFGALLHDLGKIAIPVEILEKPGKLTAQEIEIMQTHITITRDILQGYLADDILEIAVRHHEKIDGSGYPEGLTGDVLSESQRIVAIADLLSALSGHRSYKEAFSANRIKDILQQMAGEHKICPILTDFVLKNFDYLIGHSDASCRQLLQTYQAMLKKYDVLIKRSMIQINKANLSEQTLDK